MNLIALPAFTNNCTRTLHRGRPAVVVDPGGSAPAMAALDAAQLVLAAILVNPHLVNPLHADHAREFELKRGVRIADNAVAQRVRPRGADANEPLTVLAAHRPWKNDSRC
jgi:hypothetical protein